MSTLGRPRVHRHLSRETIARAGLKIVDAGGLDGLGMRSVSAALGVGTMTLYQHVPDRATLEKDIVALLLAEVDVTERPGETWDASVRRIARSLRAMTLRHPRAFVLVADAPADEPPVLEYAQPIMRLHAAQGISQDTFVKMWAVINAFLTGHMLMLAQAISREDDIHEVPAEAGIADLASGLSRELSPEAFEFGLNVVIAGLESQPDLVELTKA